METKTKITPQFTILLCVLVVVLGYVNVHSFYSPYGIQIYHYLRPSEVLLAFFPISLDVLLLLLTFIVTGFVLYGLPTHGEEPKRNKLLTSLLLVIFAIITIGFNILLLFLVHHYVLSNWNVWLMAFTITIPIFVMLLVCKIIIVFYRYFDSFGLLTVTLFALVAIYFVLHNSNLAAQNTSSKDESIRKLWLKRGGIVGYGYYFIGKTNDYYFYKRTSNDHLRVIPVSEVKEER